TATASAPRSSVSGLTGSAATPGLASISVGTADACAVRTGGAVACWGTDALALSGSFVQVSVGNATVCGLKPDATMACSGGSLTALPGTFRQLSVGPSFLCAIKLDSTVACSTGSATPPVAGFRQVSVGDQDACGVQLDGTTTCWGTTGLVPTAGTYTQVAVGNQQACGIGTSAHLACWGTGAEPTPSQSLTFSQISMAGTHGCGVQTDGTASCFGTGATSPQGSDTYVADSTGTFGSCGVQTSGEVACWDGGGTVAQFNFGHPQISAGTSTSCGIQSDGTLACSGLAQQDKPTSGTYTQVATGSTHSCAVQTDGSPVCWGDNTGQLSGAVTQVAVGHSYSCGLTVQAAVTCVGTISNTPTSGTFIEISGGADHACALATTGTVQCWGDVEVAQTDSFVDVSAGSAFSCGVRADATLSCWGTDLGVTTAVPSTGNYSTVSSGVGYACAIATDGATTCWGSPPTGKPADTFLQVSAGDGFACAINVSAAVTCWGDNSSGQAAARSLIVGPFDQGLDFSLDSAAVVDSSSSITVTKGASNNDVSLASETLAVCTTSGLTVQFLKAQQCTLHATEDGNDDYAAGDVEKSFTVSPADPAITVHVPNTNVVHGNFTATATSSGHDAGAFTFAASGAPSDSCHLGADGTTVVLDHAGQCTVTASQAATGDYNAGTGSQPFAIGQLTGTVSISSSVPATPTVGGSYTPTVQPGGSSAAVSLSAGPPAVCSLTAGVVSFDHHGTCTVEADQPADRDYTAATPSKQQIAIGPAAQAINVTNLPSGAQVGDTYTPATAPVPSQNTVVFRVDAATTNNACSVTSDGLVHYQHVGSCVLDATVAQSDNGDYSQGDLTVGPIAVGQGSQSINWATAPLTVYVGDGYTPSAQPTPAGDPTFKIDDSTPSTVCTYTNGAVQFIGKGSCVVDANQAGNDDYLAAQQLIQTITVSRIASAVDLNLSLGEVVYGQATTASASVTHNPSDRGAPTGTVQFTLAGANAGSAVTVSNGNASAPITAPSAGGASVGAAFTPTDTAKYDIADTGTTLQVDKAGTTAPVAVKPNSISTTIDVNSPGAGVPTGQVQFAVDGSPVDDPQPLNAGVATLSYTVPTGKTRHVSVHYLGDSNFVATTGSTARHDPKLTASLASVHAKHDGWYRNPVTVKFACTPVDAPLRGKCPAPVTVSKDVAARTVSKSILATNGGAATYSTSISLDQTKPKVVVAGVTSGTTYIGKAPKARCLPSDSLSGVASCHIKLKTDAAGETTYTATAADRAGNTASTTGSYRVQRYYLREAIYDASNNSYIVQTGIKYTLVALSLPRPHYYKPVRLHHKPHVDGGKMSADGRQAGIPRWKLTVSFRRTLRKHTFWNIGVRTGTTVHSIMLRVS
ncbi:MAG TPA: Ig-like domain repeat protein, partial [Jatrophihabitantaceae bacterium]|nr:Ig-like domain repeat protein [Jatrophihabitantaceae bacterium]